MKLHSVNSDIAGVDAHNVSHPSVVLEFDTQAHPPLVDLLIFQCAAPAAIAGALLAVSNQQIS
jgi:hypothetical protein